MTFTIASYNVLATAYIRPTFYPASPPACLDPAWRVPALAEAIAALDVDILCLQEVEPAVFGAIEAVLRARAYDGRYAPKLGDKPDGCATFARRAQFEIDAVDRLAFADGVAGEPASGHVALVTRLVGPGGGPPLTIFNTHLRWASPRLTGDAHVGVRQARQLVAAIGDADTASAGTIVCGDLNAEPGSEVIDVLERAGLRRSHADVPDGFTCNSNQVPKAIDHILASADLAAIPVSLPAIDGATPLPSPTQPSDHLALLARIRWIQD